MQGEESNSGENTDTDDAAHDKKPRGYEVVFLDSQAREFFKATNYRLDRRSSAYIFTGPDGTEVARIPEKNVRWIKRLD